MSISLEMESGDERNQSGGDFDQSEAKGGESWDKYDKFGGGPDKSGDDSDKSEDV